MRKNKKIILVLIFFLVFILFLGSFIFQISKEKRGQISKFEKTKPLITIPKGREVYEIAQEENVYPRFLKAIVDPLDVKPGDIQKYEVILADRVDISKVVAYIERDSGTTTLELKKAFQGPLSEKDLNQRYVVRNNILQINNPKNTNRFVFAQTENLQKFIYQGEWVVTDTHSKTYRTKIVAINRKGEKNQITLTWTDPCTPPPCGNWTVDGSCVFSITNGVENGNVTGFDAAYTVTLNAPFIVNNGYSITINNGGSFAIGTGGQIVFNEIYVRDADGDGYGLSNDQRAGSAAGYVARALKCAYDCYDANSLANPGQTNYFTVHRGDGSFDYNCSGAIEKAGVRWNNDSYQGHPSHCEWWISGFDWDVTNWSCGAGPYGYCSESNCQHYCAQDGNVCTNGCAFYIGCH